MDHRHFSKSGTSRKEHHNGKHAFEHWYRDRTVYFITARVRDKREVFVSPETSDIFWKKLTQYASEANFDLWVTTLMINHYHLLGFLHSGVALKEMMRKLHGSVAHLVCKSLNIQHKPLGWMTITTITWMATCATHCN